MPPYRKRKKVSLYSLHGLIKRRCPHCKKETDAVTGLNHRQPTDGDLSVCAYCGGLAVFTETGFRLLTTDDLEKLSEEDRTILQAFHEVGLKGIIKRNK